MRIWNNGQLSAQSWFKKIFRHPNRLGGRIRDIGRLIFQEDCLS